MSKDSDTRSGLLWQVERILKELTQKQRDNMVLLMENVPAIHSENFINDFRKWMEALEQLGFESYWEDLNGVNYKIPQSRNRTIMVSVPKGFNFTFPKPMKLDIRLKNILQDNVDEKYYLSKNHLERMAQWKSRENPLEQVLGDESISPTITTRVAESIQGGVNASTKLVANIPSTSDLRMVFGNKGLQETIDNNEIKDGTYIDSYNKSVKDDVSGTILTGVSFRNHTFVAVDDDGGGGHKE